MIINYLLTNCPLIQLIRWLKANLERESRTDISDGHGSHTWTQLDLTAGDFMSLRRWCRYNLLLLLLLLLLLVIIFTRQMFDPVAAVATVPQPMLLLLHLGFDVLLRSETLLLMLMLLMLLEMVGVDTRLDGRHHGEVGAVTDRHGIGQQDVNGTFALRQFLQVLRFEFDGDRRRVIVVHLDAVDGRHGRRIAPIRSTLTQLSSNVTSITSNFQIWLMFTNTGII